MAKKTKDTPQDNLAAPVDPVVAGDSCEPQANVPQEVIAAALASCDRQATVTQVACALLQSPRFATRCMDAAQQDCLVKASVEIADKIIAATSDPATATA